MNFHELEKLLTNLPPGTTIELTLNPQGELTVTNNQKQTKEDLLQNKYAHLVGVGISLSEAARKYGVTKGVIKAWVYRSNYIRFVDTDSYPQLINEAEVALCADIYRDRQAAKLTGLPYFDECGYVITKRKHPDLAKYRRRKKAAPE